MTTPHCLLVSRTEPATVSVRWFEAAQWHLDLLIIDEADAVQQVIDGRFVQEENLVGAGNGHRTGLYDPVFTSPEGDMLRNNTFGQGPPSVTLHRPPAGRRPSCSDGRDRQSAGTVEGPRALPYTVYPISCRPRTRTASSPRPWREPYR
ncbi:hypothetical protein [Actinoplanes italicus]|uniref:hypothetical protein n=1 Tax=Actinoplanes italicus TaxID=113567 RepID=UPI0011B210B0|nr:hypothetical protein [Actinoplanes italicus]